MRLYWRRFGVALFGDNTREFGRKAEKGKRLGQENLLQTTCCGTAPSEPVQADTTILGWDDSGRSALAGGRNREKSKLPTG
ncbi:hypothetical protein [Candidatus Accumulibacter contiguus]|uniref:hypothetical protein n=1 Tax=Candidatus Accumulibacter contiguus TaxID=2954381 RepID=UPI00145ED2D7|nr:hypothetical protein [Candidatus Accumulibacter contiguus]